MRKASKKVTEIPKTQTKISSFFTRHALPTTHVPTNNKAENRDTTNKKPCCILKTSPLKVKSMTISKRKLSSESDENCDVIPATPEPKPKQGRLKRNPLVKVKRKCLAAVHSPHKKESAKENIGISFLNNRKHFDAGLIIEISDSEVCCEPTVPEIIHRKKEIAKSPTKSILETGNTSETCLRTENNLKLTDNNVNMVTLTKSPSKIEKENIGLHHKKDRLIELSDSVRCCKAMKLDNSTPNCNIDNGNTIEPRSVSEIHSNGRREDCSFNLTDINMTTASLIKSPCKESKTHPVDMIPMNLLTTNEQISLIKPKPSGNCTPENHDRIVIETVDEIKTTDIDKCNLNMSCIVFEDSFKVSSIDTGVQENTSDNKIDNCDLADLCGINFEESFRVSGIGLQDNKSEHLTTSINTVEQNDITEAEECCIDGFLDGSWSSDAVTKVATTTLDLSKWQRCKVLDVKVDHNLNGKILELQSTKNHATAYCLLQIPWCNCRIEIGDVVSILGTPLAGSPTSVPWCIDTTGGFLVTTPDSLVSGTSVVGGLFCARKGVLSDSYKGIDCENRIMTIGSLVHELFQSALKVSNAPLLMEKLCTELITSPRSMSMLYSSGMSTVDARKEIEQFCPKIEDFINTYVRGQKPVEKDNWSGQIKNILDIEENIWSPRLGLKGKVDVTVQVKINPRVRKAERLPLELKTGRASFSAEHKGQVILYTMMMSELGHPVDSGLLLYLREGIMKEVSVSHNEKRDLIMLRNELSYYLSRKHITDSHSKKRNEPEASLKQMDLLEYIPNLPEPINHHSACSKCPYVTLCSLFLSHDKSITLADSNPLKALSKDAIWHLSPAHREYFLHWTSMLYLEDLHNLSMSANKSLWTTSSEEREKQGKCLSNLKIEGKILRSSSSFVHCFVKSSDVVCDMETSGFAVGNYVIVSTDKRVNVVCGHVEAIANNAIMIVIDRDISKMYGRFPFHIDAYHSQSLLSYNLTNLGVLLDDTQSCEKLRRLIIDKQPPQFTNKLSKSVAEIAKNVLSKLNSIQQRAVLKTLTANDYLLVQGMPGTGKTQTMVSLINLMVSLKKSVLITSHTHSAVDNVLLRLHEIGVGFLRLGSEARIHSKIHYSSEAQATKDCKSAEELEDVYNKAMVVGVTCLGSSHPLLSRRRFDVCLVDESTQVLQASVLRPLFSADKFVLIGDPEQLAPLVSNVEAKQHGLDESLFSRLVDTGGTVLLTLQYRMNQTITDLANKLTYKGQLECANLTVASSVINVPQKILEQKVSEKWIMEVLSPILKDSVKLLDTGNTFQLCKEYFELQKDLSGKHDGLVSESCQRSKYNNGELEERKAVNNICEAAVVVYVVQVLVEAGIEKSSIGIIAPYRAQVNLLQALMKQYNKCNRTENASESQNIEVNTVDQYQGQDRDIIIYSCTRSTDLQIPKSKPRDTEILNDKRRLTVAITRSKKKLIIVGDLTTLNDYGPFGELLKCVSSEHKLNIQHEQYGFTWNTVFANLERFLQKEDDVIMYECD